MKIGRNEFDINENDLILDNGSCYQIVTRTTDKGWNSSYPVISKTIFNNFVRDNIVFTNNELKSTANNKCGSYCTYWKFNMEMINE